MYKYRVWSLSKFCTSFVYFSALPFTTNLMGTLNPSSTLLYIFPCIFFWINNQIVCNSASHVLFPQCLSNCLMNPYHPYVEALLCNSFTLIFLFADLSDFSNFIHVPVHGWKWTKATCMADIMGCQYPFCWWYYHDSWRWCRFNASSKDCPNTGIWISVNGYLQSVLYF